MRYDKDMHDLLGTPPPPRAFEMTDRDWLILALIGRYRFITPELVVAALGGSLKNIGRRLHLMWRARFITRPLQQKTLLAAHHFHGAAPLVYELGRRGARLLAERGIKLRIDCSFRTGAFSPLMHALETTRFMIDLGRATARIHGLSLIEHADLIDGFPVATQSARRPFSLAVTVAEQGGRATKTNTPDRLLSLVHGNERWNFAYERDRSTETVQPHSLSNKSTIFRKQSVMYHAFRQGLFAARWNFQRLRVLTHTSGSHRRIAAMLDTQHHAVTDGKAPGMFLYASDAELAAHGPLAPIWLSAEIKTVAEELAAQSRRIGRQPSLLQSDRRERIARLAEILRHAEGVSLLPPSISLQPEEASRAETSS